MIWGVIFSFFSYSGLYFFLLGTFSFKQFGLQSMCFFISFLRGLQSILIRHLSDSACE